MAGEPLSIERVPNDCNGKKKYIIREREYDMLSGGGLKLILKVAMIAVGIVASILTAYYTAEAGQNHRIDNAAAQSKEVGVRQQENTKALTRALDKLDRTMTEQRAVIDKTNASLNQTREVIIRVDANQQNLEKTTSGLVNKVEQLNTELKTHRHTE